MLVGTVAGSLINLALPSTFIGLRERMGSTSCPFLSRSWSRAINSEKGFSSDSLIDASRITHLYLKGWESILRLSLLGSLRADFGVAGTAGASGLVCFCLCLGGERSSSSVI